MFENRKKPIINFLRAATLDNLRQVEHYVTKYLNSDPNLMYAPPKPLHSLDPMGPPNYGIPPPSNAPPSMHQQQMTPQPMQWSNQGWVDDKSAQMQQQQPNQQGPQPIYMSQRSQPYGIPPQVKGSIPPSLSQNMQHYRPDSQQAPYQNSQFPPMYAPVSMQNQSMQQQQQIPQQNAYSSVSMRPQSQPPQMMHQQNQMSQQSMMIPPTSQSIYGNDLISSDAMHTSFDDIYMPMSDLGSTSSDVNMRTGSITNELPNSIPGDGMNTMMQPPHMSGITPGIVGEQAYSEIINVEDRFQFSLVTDPGVPSGPLLKCKLSMYNK